VKESPNIIRELQWLCAMCSHPVAKPLYLHNEPMAYCNLCGELTPSVDLRQMDQNS